MQASMKQVRPSCKASTSSAARPMSVRAPSRRTPLLRVAAMFEGAAGVEGAPSQLPAGTRVRVSGAVKVYHVPKQTQGIDLQGLEGTIEKNVALYTDKKGVDHVLSPNLPYFVKVTAQIDSKDVAIKAHLEEDELEVIS